MNQLRHDEWGWPWWWTYEQAALGPPPGQGGQVRRLHGLYWAATQLARPDPLPFQRAADLIQYRWVVDRRRHGPGVTVGDLLHGPAQDLAGASFRQPRHRHRELESRNRSDLVAHQRDDLAFDLDRRTFDPGFKDNKTARHLALELVLDADHRAFRDVAMRGQHLLHAACRQPMP